MAASGPHRKQNWFQKKGIISACADDQSSVSIYAATGPTASNGELEGVTGKPEKTVSEKGNHLRMR
jgi:hypothetical protein